MNAPVIENEAAAAVEVRLELTDEQALALAQFVKRVGWSEMRGCAIDDQEAHIIRSALNELQEALAYQGYAPR